MPSQRKPVFGKRSEPHTVIIAHGEHIRHFTVRPWMAAAAGSMIALLSIGYLLATTYLVLRDDLIGAGMARQARLQQAYEDRISALRAQVDRITSRQLLDQQLMQRKVGELIERQEKLTQRHGRLGPVLEKASRIEGGREQAPLPTPRPEIRAGFDGGGAAVDDFVTASAYANATPAATPWPLRTAKDLDLSEADRADQLFVTINKSLRSIETEQIERIEMLTGEAYETAETIAEALQAAGIKADVAFGEEAVGGPLVAAADNAGFEVKVRELDEALSTLEHLKKTARRVPIANPLPGAAVTSTFGVRRDPILRRPAHHSGMDFRGGTGAPIRAAGAGKVVKAGWNGGYGRMIEIDHGNGLTTRYAHMSKLLVREGAHIEVGAVIGKVGSSGRSTGPHLHYEVRKNGTAINPLNFLTAGQRIDKFL
ncbi:M23 family metallopeptidase [Nitratireductor thuwali]|uniref:Murein DD-endopeptidase MepM n=1 Tax=Nitratireductor thuwali TaxID=2267699 RepID=A0ABY5MQE4_9HYPH|nr:Murein DD-endopeptidase MepM [Nitratireductor thuwali]